MDSQSEPKQQPESTAKFSAEVSDKRFWRKVKRYAVKAGYQVIFTALQLYYALQDSDTPTASKTIIVGALLYFILPADVVFDWLPGGYVDDMGTLAAALWAVAENIKPVHSEQAKSIMRRWFDEQ